MLVQNILHWAFCEKLRLWGLILFSVWWKMQKRLESALITNLYRHLPILGDLWMISQSLWSLLTIRNLQLLLQNGNLSRWVLMLPHYWKGVWNCWFNYFNLQSLHLLFCSWRALNRWIDVWFLFLLPHCLLMRGSHLGLRHLFRWHRQMTYEKSLL